MSSPRFAGTNEMTNRNVQFSSRILLDEHIIADALIEFELVTISRLV